MTKNKENKPEQAWPKVRISESLLADLRQYNADETKRFGGLKRAASYGELLERAWAVYLGRPEPVREPEDETIAQLREVLEKDKELCEQSRHFVRTMYGVLRHRLGLK